MKVFQLLFLVFSVFSAIFAEQIANQQDLLSVLASNKKILQTPSKLQEVYDPLLVVVIMIKNEATVIKQTLQPYIDAKIQHFVVYDTGSTDETVSIVKTLFQENNIQHGIIKEEPFIDFATSRNRALTIARETFPNGCFMLMPDAEWVMQDVPGLLKFCEENQHETTADAYRVRAFAGNNLDYPTDRLIRCKSKALFQSPIHEYLVANYSSKDLPSSVFFNWHQTPIGQEKSQQRWRRDCEILLREHKEKPKDQRVVFYLGQTYDCLGDLNNACLFYEMCANMNGWDEERYMALYRVGGIYERMKRWDQALFQYLAAYSIRPTRAEPLVAIARYYLNKDIFATAYLFASRAVELSYPTNDKLFLERRIYDYERYDVLARSAWYIKEYEVGEKAAELALAGCPDAYRENAQQNLDCYRNVHKK